MNAKLADRTFVAGEGTTGGPVLVGSDGWLLWRVGENLDVRVRVEERADGYESVAICAELRDGAAVTGTTLRDIAIGRLAAALRDPTVRVMIRSAEDAPGPVLAPGGTLSRFDAKALEKRVVLGAAKMLVLPTPPERGRKTDDFYFGVALTYSIAQKTSRRPAVDMAAANDVPVETMRRWIKEARRRSEPAPRDDNEPVAHKVRRIVVDDEGHPHEEIG